MDSHDASGGVVAAVRPGAGLAGVGHDEGNPRVGAVAGFRGLNEARAGIDAGEFCDFRFEQWPDEDALAAADVDDRLAGFWVEHAEGGGENDVLVIVRARLTDELVIPSGDRIPPTVLGRWLTSGWWTGLPRFGMLERAAWWRHAEKIKAEERLQQVTRKMNRG